MITWGYTVLYGPKLGGLGAKRLIGPRSLCRYVFCSAVLGSGYGPIKTSGPRVSALIVQRWRSALRRRGRLTTAREASHVAAPNPAAAQTKNLSVQ